MRRTRLLLLVALALPATVLAQFPGGMGGGGMGRRGGRGGAGREGEERGAPPALPTNAEVEQQDPIVLLMGKRHELSLSDSQFTQLTRLDATLMEENRPLMARLDSARTAVPTLVVGDSAAPTPTERGGSGRAGAGEGDRRTFMEALRQIRRNDDATATQALALLNGDQRARAEKLIDDQRKKLDDAMGRRGPGPLGRRPRGDGAPE